MYPAKSLNAEIIQGFGKSRWAVMADDCTIASGEIPGQGRASLALCKETVLLRLGKNVEDYSKVIIRITKECYIRSM